MMSQTGEAAGPPTYAAKAQTIRAVFRLDRLSKKRLHELKTRHVPYTVFYLVSLTVGIIYVVEIAVTLTLGGLHIYFSLPLVTDVVAHTGGSPALLRVSGLVYLSLAFLHSVALGRILLERCCKWHPKQQRITPAITSQESPDHKTSRCTRVIRCIIKVVVSPLRLWRCCFGVNGIFGLNGEYFDQFFQVRETVEVLLQTYQLYFLSRAIPERWINSLAASVVVLNCFGVALIDALPGLRYKERRLSHLLLDMTLDLTCAVVIPLCILVPYIQVVDWSTGLVPVQFALDDAWYASAVAAFQQVMITSVLDFLSSFMPHVSSFVALSTLRRLLPRIQAHAHRKVTKVVPESAPTHDSRRRRSSIKPNRWSLRLKRWISLVARIVTVACGIFVLGAHLDAHFHGNSDLTGCRVVVPAWFDHTRVPCSVLQINCFRDGIEGSADELRAQLTRTEPSVLTKLILTHCEAVVMPAILSEFARLQSLETYNCTLVDWPMHAALRRQTHPALSYVYLMETNMSAFPTGLLHSELPATFNNFRVYRSNLSVLPESLGDLWADQRMFAFAIECTDVATLPLSLRRLRSFAYHLISNRIEAISDEIFADARPGWLWLSGNPLQRLPHVGDTSRLEELLVEWTNVSEPTPWLSNWLATHSTTTTLPFVSFYGSPICIGLVDAVSRYCWMYRDSDTSSLAMEWLVPQRML
ncbi:hypothetical protein PINS_up003348 [Pythium insidiosum]|nr:hypothetical protein PINS_up003348 [Pythium insidiosum]